MEFFKKNYEKVVLGVVLFGLTVTACLLLLVIIPHKRAALEETRINLQIKPKPLPPADNSVFEAAIREAQTRVNPDFSTNHNLFNPVLWKKFPDGHLLKEQTGNEEGVGALEVTAIHPLYLQLTYDSPSGNGYLIKIDRANAPQNKQHSQNFVSKDNKSELLSLDGIKGPQEKPSELDLKWNETSEPIILKTDKPYRRVEGYSADLKYPLEPNKVWLDHRVNNRPLIFAGGRYIIVAITETNVIVQDESTTKKTTIAFHPASESR